MSLEERSGISVDTGIGIPSSISIAMQWELHKWKAPANPRQGPGNQRTSGDPINANTISGCASQRSQTNFPGIIGEEVYAAFLIVLLLLDPHALEGGKRGEDRPADPHGVFPLRRGDDLDLHRVGREVHNRSKAVTGGVNSAGSGNRSNRF
eukprot:gene6740-biopygen5840